jgi:hypothetical protein
MEDNPYQPPDHYAAKTRNTVPLTAYFMSGMVLLSGVSMAAYGFYYLLAGTALAGLFWSCVGLTGTYYIVQYRRRPK